MREDNHVIKILNQPSQIYTSGDFFWDMTGSSSCKVNRSLETSNQSFLRVFHMKLYNKSWIDFMRPYQVFESIHQTHPHGNWCQVHQWEVPRLSAARLQQPPHRWSRWRGRSGSSASNLRYRRQKERNDRPHRESSDSQLTKRVQD